MACSTMNHPVDCIVIGGGVIGMTSALALTEAGASVILLEQSRLGMESSWAGGGILCPLTLWSIAPSLFPMFDAGVRYYRLLARGTGGDIELHRSGLLLLPPYPPSVAGQASHALRSLAWKEADPALIKEHAPALPAQQRGWWFSEVWQLRNSRLIRLLRQRLQEKKITVIESTKALRLLVKERRCLGVTSKDGNIHADYTVLAAGAWSGEILRPFAGDALGMLPVKGEMLAYAAGESELTCILLQQDCYLIPRHDGLILAGSTVTEASFDKKPTQQAYRWLQQRSGKMLPLLKGKVPSYHWTGLRPRTSDHFPVIGAWPGLSGLYLNTGHFRNGIALAPASALLLRDLILERTPTFNPTPFQATRFFM